VIFMRRSWGVRWIASGIALARAAGAQPAPSNAAQLASQGIALEAQACSSEDYQSAQCAQAVDMLERAVQQDPGLTDANVALADAHWNRAFEYPKAAPQRLALQQRSVVTLQKLVDAKVQDSRPYYQLSLRKTDDASRRTLLERAIQIAPEHALAHRDLAEVYLRAADAPKAAATYQRYQSLRSGGGTDGARQDLGFANRLLALNHPSGAQTIFKTAFEQTKEEPRTTRCNVFSKVNPAVVNGGLQQEMNALLPACTNDANFKRAVDLQRRGQSDAAIQALQTQVQTNPQHVESYLLLEHLYQAKGDTGKAAEIVNRYDKVETDTKERCRRLHDERLRAQLQPQARVRLDQECPK
jgi:Tfp pilus assembly protein PilF